MAEAAAHAGSSARGSFRGRRGGARRPWRGRGGASHESPKKNFERPTHFVSVPLDHIQGFTSQVAQFTDTLLAVSPPITGLDPSIVISPARLHLTIGVMALTDDERQSEERPNDSFQNPNASGQVSQPPLEPPKTASQALDLLQSLKSEIQTMLNNEPLQLNLDELAVMRRSEEGEADVMYIGPTPAVVRTEAHSQSVKVLESIYRRFREEGFVTDTRPLKLHCTVLNTSHRKPANRRSGRVPFSMSQIEEAVAQNPHMTGTLLSSSVPLTARELNICRMGSWDRLGRYVRVGGIKW